MTISAYVSIFDDWEFLGEALASIEPMVDEIVVVDGAYSWMRPLLDPRRRPERSRDEVHDVLGGFGRKIRVVTGTWANETEKRVAGYENCRGRHVLRHDADEVVIWHADVLERFLASPFAVGATEIPLFVAPGRVKLRDPAGPLPRLGVLFDRDRISALHHISYLWVVMADEERAGHPKLDPRLVFKEPIAFSAHYTVWRGPDSSIGRARFYVFNHFRSLGRLTWFPSVPFDPGIGFDALGAAVEPRALDEALIGHRIVAGPADTDGAQLVPFDRHRDVLARHDPAYRRMLERLAARNRELLARPRPYVADAPYVMDATLPDSLAGMVDAGGITFETSDEVRRAGALFRHLHEDGGTRETMLATAVSGRRTRIELPADATGQLPPGVLRRTLQFTLAGAPAGRLPTLSVRA